MLYGFQRCFELQLHIVLLNWTVNARVMGQELLANVTLSSLF